MNNKKREYRISAGLLCISLAIILKQFIDSTALSEFMSGFLMGLGICFEFAGMLRMRKNKN